MHMTSWEKVCLPKSYGGIDFKEGSKWNPAMISKYVWEIMEKKDLLWVKWVNLIYLKDESFWSYNQKPDTSCSLLIQNRDPYSKAIWSFLSLPKHQFILWQIVNSHLLTRDNLSKFHIPLESRNCPVCEDHLESHDHLFFSCAFSRRVADRTFEWLGNNTWPVRNRCIFDNCSRSDLSIC
uniref:Reverse transcriptase zinc-binding domain-containing protein n=1 Tax=Cannabis sativa TaxID=3483 RepID=A0A803Q8J2_CANSA